MKVRGRLQKTGIWSRESGVNYTLTATEVGHDGNNNNHFDNLFDVDHCQDQHFDRLNKLWTTKNIPVMVLVEILSATS